MRAACKPANATVGFGGEVSSDEDEVEVEVSSSEGEDIKLSETKEKSCCEECNEESDKSDKELSTKRNC